MKKAKLPKVSLEINFFFTVTFPRSSENVGKSSEKSWVKILKLIEEDKKISAQELSEKVGINSRAVEKQLAIGRCFFDYFLSNSR